MGDDCESKVKDNYGEEWFIKGKAYYDKGEYAKAIDCYKKAADEGYADAQYALAEHYRISAEMGDVTSQYLLGRCYYYGKGVDRDYAEAAEWFTKAAEKNHIEAQYYLGLCYEYGSDIKDYDKAFKWYLQAAENGNGEAQCQVGSCYFEGKGVEENIDKAIEWVRQASENGVVYAKPILSFYTAVAKSHGNRG